MHAVQRTIQQHTSTLQNQLFSRVFVATLFVNVLMNCILKAHDRNGSEGLAKKNQCESRLLNSFKIVTRSKSTPADTDYFVIAQARLQFIDAHRAWQVQAVFAETQDVNEWGCHEHHCPRRTFCDYLRS